MEKLKQFMLKHKIVQDNANFSAYLNLIALNYDTKKQFGLTECHHAIPVHVYKDIFKISSYAKATRVANKDTNNILVNLTYKDHVLAHYYLAMCALPPFKDKCIYAFNLMTVNKYRYIDQIDFNSFVADLDNYQDLRTQYFELLSKELDPGTKFKISNALKGKAKPTRTDAHKEALAKARNFHSTTAGKKAIYNKESNKVKFVSEQEITEYIEQGWVLGGKPLSEEAKQKMATKISAALKGKKHVAGKGSGLESRKIICIETGQIFNNITEASAWLQNTVGISGGQIKNCCSGAREQTGGYHWKYYEKGENNVERI